MSVCTTCGTTFELPADVAAKFPGWSPSQCRSCHTGKAGGGGGTAKKGGRRSGGRGRPASSGVEENLTVDEVLAKYHDGPTDGVFTDGSASPNPGPGGWGAVYVVDGEVQARSHGHDPDTTNNRMELEAISQALELVPEGTAVDLYTDSKLCVDTLTTWAHGWAAKGWTRKGGPIKNLDLIRPLFARLNDRPEVTLRWIAAHSGNRWNEYADALSTAYLRDSV